MSNTERLRSLEYYLNLRYPVSLRELGPDEGGGYLATIPLLGEGTFKATGETPTEALEALAELRHLLIPKLLEKGVELPEPDAESVTIEQYSGNLVLRIPRGLHARLAAEAKRHGCSINKLATQLLSQGVERAAWNAELQQTMAELRHELDGLRASGRAALSTR